MARKLQLLKRHALFFWAVSPFINRLPRKLWQWFYRPLPRSAREESLFESCQSHYRAAPWPDTFFLDPALGKHIQDISFLTPFRPSVPEIIEVNNAVVLANGLVVTNNSINFASSCYVRLSRHILFRTSAFWYTKRTRINFDAATLISRQLVDQGTYGDYFIEFILPLCRACEAVKPPLLADAGFIKKYCHADLKALGLPPCLSIPIEGIQVKKLTVIASSQPFDNFDPANLAAVARAFRLPETHTARADKVYLSRRGFFEATSSKQKRSLENEAEIEHFLTSRGFVVLRPDGTNNLQTRIQLAGAEIVIFNHGSGFLNAVWGNPRSVVELASEQWWNPAFLRLSRAMNVSAYHLLCSQNGRIDIEKLSAVLKTLGC